MIQLKNNAQSMLAYPISAADTTLTVIPEDIGRFPVLTVPGDHFYCALADSQGNLEFVRVTGANSQAATLTVVRGAEGTAAQGWNTGDRVQLRMSMATWTDMAGDWWKRVKTASGDAIAPTLVSATSFSLSGDWTGEMQTGRRLRITSSNGTLFKGHVASAVLVNGTTTTTVGGDPEPQLAGTLVAVDMGFSTEMESHLAKIWADEAETSKNAAATSAWNAETSATASATSAAEALASKTAAGGSAATANTKATEAATSASTASTKAAAASNSATAASDSAAQASADALRAETAAGNAEAIAGGLFVPLTRNITAGTGLSGGGDLTADRTLAVTFGSTAGTACQGNDARLSNARIPTAHKSTHATGGADALTPADIGAQPAGDYALTSDIATPIKAGLVKPRSGLTVDALGNLDVERAVFALGYPGVTMTPKIATGRPTNVSLSAPAVLLPGATVTAYHVSVDGGPVQDVTAVNNAATFSFTPAGAAGTTATLKVTATDSVGNTSLTTTATAQVVNGYVVAPTIISPAAGANLYSTPIPVVTSAFSVFGTDDTHASTDWKITSDEAGNTIASEALASTDLIAHTFPAITVATVTQRHLWARHNGQNIGPSEWGHIAVTINPSRHGEILYDTSNNPAAVITGSYLSGGKEPWCIRGRYVWLAFALASKRGVDKTWNLSSSDSNYVDIPTIENPGTSWKLAANNTAADGSGSYVSALSTEAHMDASFTYTQTVKTSKELTDAILVYNASYMAAQFSRSVTLKDLGAMDLPSIDVLMRLYQARTIVDALDPTASANTAKKLSAWGFGSAGGTYVWSASEYDSGYAWSVNSDGKLSNTSKSTRFGCVPSLEIPA